MSVGMRIEPMTLPLATFHGAAHDSASLFDCSRPRPRHLWQCCVKLNGPKMIHYWPKLTTFFTKSWWMIIRISPRATLAESKTNKTHYVELNKYSKRKYHSDVHKIMTWESLYVWVTVSEKWEAYCHIWEWSWLASLPWSSSPHYSNWTLVATLGKGLNGWCQGEKV